MVIESLDTPITKNEKRVIVQLSDIDENLKFIFRFRRMINTAHATECSLIEVMSMKMRWHFTCVLFVFRQFPFPILRK